MKNLSKITTKTLLSRLNAGVKNEEEKIAYIELLTKRKVDVSEFMPKANNSTRNQSPLLPGNKAKMIRELIAGGLNTIAAITKELRSKEIPVRDTEIRRLLKEKSVTKEMVN